MPRSTALAIAAALLMVIAAAAVRASWDGDEAAGAEPAPSTASTAGPAAPTSTTERADVTFPAPATTAPATTAPPETSPPTPLDDPTSLPLPRAESISVNAGSSYSTSFTVGAPSPDDVVRWLLDGLVVGGWDVVRVGGADGAWAVVEFRGPGAHGEATVTDLDGDAVEVAVELTPPRS